MMKCKITLLCLVLGIAQQLAVAQSSSLSERKREHDVNKRPDEKANEIVEAKQNRVYMRHSWINLTPPKPKTVELHDLVTIIVRENRQFQSDAQSNVDNRLEIESSLDAFIKPTDGGLGSSDFRRGKPNIDYEWRKRNQQRGDNRRQDNLVLRITAKVIDIKPNGTMILEGKFSIKYEEEQTSVTVVGTCRQSDILPDNTVLSSQLADKSISIANSGAVRDATKRGFVTKVIDFLKPF